MRVLIAVPTFESIRPETFKSIYGLDRAGHEVLFDYVRGYDCARARNLIAQECLDYGFDAVLTVDSDVVVPPDALRLLAEGDCPVVLGTYPRRGETAGSEVFLPGRRDFTDENRVSFADMPRGRFPAKGGGLGCALIRRGAFEALARPWFRYVQYDSGAVLSEDNYFCCEAAKAGLGIEADGRVRCGHVAAAVTYGGENGR